MDTDQCVVCGLANQQSENADFPNHVSVTCERCGNFKWEPATTVVRPVTDAGRVKLPAFIREQNAAGSVPFLTPLVLRQVEQRRIPRLRDRALRALAAMVEVFGYDLDVLFGFSDMLQIPAVSYCKGNGELHVLLKILQKDGLVIVSGPPGEEDVRLTPAGLVQAEELTHGGAGIQGFVCKTACKTFQIPGVNSVQ